MSGKAKITTAVLLTFIITSLSFFALFGLPVVLGVSDGFRNLGAVCRLIKANYIKDFDAAAAEEAAIWGVISTLDDPYANYYTPEQTENMLLEFKGQYIGVGVVVFINPQDNAITVLQTYEDSPAQKAGMQPMDKIVAVDGVRYDGSGLNYAVGKIKGVDMDKPEGTPVSVTVERKGADEEITLEMTRENIAQFAVKSEMKGDLLYIKYTGFDETSIKKFEDIVNARSESCKGIILDLRGNPGGNVDSALKMCDIFLDEKLIMYTQNRKGEKDERYSDKTCVSLPLAVLVDKGSASSSEIVAGAFKAHARATLIGETTYGKGVSQAIYLLPGSGKSGGGAFEVTSAWNYLPDGTNVNGVGIEPDIKIETQGEGETDAALLKAIEVLGG